MGRKAQQSEPAPVPQGPSVTLATAIREALADLGRSASKAQVEIWIKSHYPTMTYKEATLNSSLSNIRKKLRGEDLAAVPGEPTVADLLRIKATATERGGVDQPAAPRVQLLV